jgi:glycosyltransferase involved in cell wall biosynthesis
LIADEVVIVDGGSSDATSEIIRKFSEENPKFGIRLIVDSSCSKKHSHGPIAKGRNRAISEAKNEIIAITDAGCRLAPDWLQKLILPLVDGQADVVIGGFTVLSPTREMEDLCKPFESGNGELQGSSRSFALTKSSWSEVGGYPELTYTAEDTLFVKNLKKKGFRFKSVPNAIVEWVPARTKEELRCKLIAYGEGDGFNFIDPGKYFLRAVLITVFPALWFLRPLYKSNIPYWVLKFFYKNQLIGYWRGIGKRISISRKFNFVRA